MTYHIIWFIWMVSWWFMIMIITISKLMDSLFWVSKSRQIFTTVFQKKSGVRDPFFFLRRHSTVFLLTVRTGETHGPLDTAAGAVSPACVPTGTMALWNKELNLTNSWKWVIAPYSWIAKACVCIQYVQPTINSMEMEWVDKPHVLIQKSWLLR